MSLILDGSGTITGASTLATTVARPTLTTPNIDSAQFATVSGTAPLYACRAWVNFNGTGTVAIRASGNVSSITDHAVGQYTANFTTAMPDANYAASITTQAGLTAYGFGTGDNTQTSAALVNIFAVTHTGVLQDASNVSVAIFR